MRCMEEHCTREATHQSKDQAHKLCRQHNAERVRIHWLMCAGRPETYWSIR